MKGKGLLAILGAPKSADGPSDDIGGEAKRQAAGELRSALEAKDDDAFAEAFQRMYDLCADGGDYEDEE